MRGLLRFLIKYNAEIEDKRISFILVVLDMDWVAKDAEMILADRHQAIAELRSRNHKFGDARKVDKRRGAWRIWILVGRRAKTPKARRGGGRDNREWRNLVDDAYAWAC
jgi:hypothetical protein